jgi:hypothetical protein
MGMRIDDKKDWVRRIEKNKDDIERRNKEIQKNNKQRRGQGK